MNEIRQETNFLMKKYNIKANKNLGQNFLIDEEAINTIVESSNIKEKDLVIEIGPGLGTLTKMLLERAKKVICIELDENMVNILEDRFKLYKNIEILNQDILRTDLREIIKKEKQSGNVENVKIVANLPYYITTPIVMMLLEKKLDLDSITVMVQKEVAERLIAIPGHKNTGAITYTVYYYADSCKVLEVPNTSFIPEPEVTSEVIKLKIRKEPPVKTKSEDLMFKIIKGAFMQRRKTLLNSLTNFKIFDDKKMGLEVLKRVGLKENVRAEELSLENFAQIADVLINLKNDTKKDLSEEEKNIEEKNSEEKNNEEENNKEENTKREDEKDRNK